MTDILLGSNIGEGAIVALKMLGGVAVAAVLLYLVLILSRVLGTKIEEKKYQAYCDKYRQEHGSEEGMQTKEEYIETRAKAGAVVWKREDKAPKVIAELPQEEPQANESNESTPADDGIESTSTDDVSPADEDNEQ